MNKKVAIVGTAGLPANYGGWETLVHNLTLHLHHRFDITVFCSSKKYNNKIKEFNSVKLEYISLNANGIQSIPYDIIAIYRSLKFANTILILGVSGCILLPFVRFFGSSKIIVNIDGLEWKRDKWGKFAKIFLKFSERIAVNFSNIIITDNKAIQDYVEKKYSVKSHLVAYGSDNVYKGEVLDLSNNYEFLTSDFAFKVCRVEPENNLHLILKVFSSFTSYPLVIVGNWKNSKYGLNLKLKYQKFPNIFLIDPIYDQSILYSIRSKCTIYIHGHSAGGTNPSLVEAMYLGLPVIAFDVVYNRVTTENKALYFNNYDELSAILKDISKINLKKISSDLKSIAQKKYTWSSISEKYAKLF